MKKDWYRWFGLGALVLVSEVPECQDQNRVAPVALPISSPEMVKRLDNAQLEQYSSTCDARVIAALQAGDELRARWWATARVLIIQEKAKRHGQAKMAAGGEKP